MSRRNGLIALILGISPVVATHAQAAADNHSHEGFEFAHPLVTESPSPDTKIRLDFLQRTVTDSAMANGTARIEAEYAFRPWVSLALTVPFEWRNAEGSRSSGVAMSAEREWSASISSLYHVSERSQALLELDTRRALSGPEEASEFTYLSPGAKFVPFANRSIMLGVSLRLPVSTAREFQHELLLTAMYHF